MAGEVAMTAVARPPLLVVALGGNAISPPTGDLSIAAERDVIAMAARELAALATADGYRLLVVHGNGPQAGRLLLAEDVGPEALDAIVAQTQGEIGYLLAEALEAAGSGPVATLVSRTLVDGADPAFRHPSKPVGRVLKDHPEGISALRTPDGRGWRRVVASPRPLAVAEAAAIETLLASHHVVAGGGGGVALIEDAGMVDGGGRIPAPAIVDKDYVAALLAIALGAERLVFVTAVPHVSEHFGTPDETPIEELTTVQGHGRLARGEFAAGSMAPKVESAVRYTEATGRTAVITMPGRVAAALRGEAGTRIVP